MFLTPGGGREFTMGTLSSNVATRFARPAAIALLAVTAWSNAQAAKYLVQFRSDQSYLKIESALKDALKLNEGRVDVFGRTLGGGVRLMGSDAKAIQTLPNLRMAVVEASDDDAALLANQSDVNLIEREFFYPSPAFSKPRPNNNFVPGRVGSVKELTWGLKAIRAREAWGETRTGVAGYNSKVVVLDTGIDRAHPDLAARFAEGKNFVERVTEDENSNRSLNNILGLFSANIGTLADPPYDYFDQAGHGTHVAGTIAAELDGKGVVGVAPRSRIYMGRVCGKFGCSSIAIIKGIEWAIQKQADVVSMSLGGAMRSQAQEEALQKAQDANVFNVAASGNSGTNQVSFPAAYSSVLAVGAVDVTLKKAAFSQWGPELGVVAPGVDVLSTVPMGSGRESKVQVQLAAGMTEVASQSFVGSEESSTPVVRPLKLAGIGKPEEFTGSFKGAIALIERGTISFADKVKNALAAGADGVLIYNNTSGLISGALTQDGSSVGIPVAMVEQTVGQQLAEALKTGGAAQVSMATARTDYAAFQGTSMATPHVAGVAALIRATNKNLTPVEVRDIIKSTSTALQSSSGENEYGSGIVNAQLAVQKAASMLRGPQ
jgi:serine protease